MFCNYWKSKIYVYLSIGYKNSREKLIKILLKFIFQKEKHNFKTFLTYSSLTRRIVTQREYMCQITTIRVCIWSAYPLFLSRKRLRCDDFHKRFWQDRDCVEFGVIQSMFLLQIVLGSSAVWIRILWWMTEISKDWMCLMGLLHGTQ